MVGEEDIELGRIEELPRPPPSNAHRIEQAGLRPQRISNLNDNIEHTIMLVKRIERHRRWTNIVSFGFVITVCLLFAFIIVFLILLKTGVLCFC